MDGGIEDNPIITDGPEVKLRAGRLVVIPASSAALVTKNGGPASSAALATEKGGLENGAESEDSELSSYLILRGIERFKPKGCVKEAAMVGNVSLIFASRSGT